MKWLDTAFAWLLVLLGSANFLAEYVPKLAVLRGPWAGGTAAAIVAAGLMNAVRSRRAGDRLLRWTTAAATLLAAWACLVVLYHYSGNVLHHPAALAAGVLAVVELIFALLGR
jgi:hypothetical protein